MGNQNSDILACSAIPQLRRLVPQIPNNTLSKSNFIYNTRLHTEMGIISP